MASDGGQQTRDLGTPPVPVMSQDKVIERRSGQAQRAITDNRKNYVIYVYLKFDVMLM
jgi:hypothetical protein